MWLMNRVLLFESKAVMLNIENKILILGSKDESCIYEKYIPTRPETGAGQFTFVRPSLQTNLFDVSKLQWTE